MLSLNDNHYQFYDIIAQLIKLYSMEARTKIKYVHGGKLLIDQYNVILLLFIYYINNYYSL